MNVSEAIATRRSVRKYLPDPVSLSTIQKVFDKARWSPSGCNFQPWEGTVLAGQPLKDLQAKLVSAPRDDPLEYDWSIPDKVEKYLKRKQELGASMYGALGIKRDDTESRRNFVVENLKSYGAPALLVIYFPKMMEAPQWSDVGMWLQSVMLLLREEGLDSCPQELLGWYGRTIKAHLGLPDDYIVFCGLTIGKSDSEAPINTFERPRVPLSDQVKFVGFD